ncbi:MAG: hypothetical protein H7A44_07745 [Opitutaceae bacterium]|nr:hypothetical protein [Cephaloticoccus sp.]MCP5530320.1 hypothetical protein [Opitutaceae bacterium]
MLKTVSNNLIQKVIRIIIAFGAVASVVSCSTGSSGFWKPKPIGVHKLVSGGGEIDCKYAPDSRNDKLQNYLTFSSSQYLEKAGKCVMYFSGGGYDGGRCFAYTLDSGNTIEATMNNYLKSITSVEYLGKIKYIDDKENVEFDNEANDWAPFLVSDIPEFIANKIVKPGAVLVVHSAL